MQQFSAIILEMLKTIRGFRFEFNQFCLVAFGATLGALTRWQINNSLMVNLIGAAILGILVGISARPPIQLFVGVGFCSSLTTFSGWIVNCAQLVDSGHWVQALRLISSTLIFGLFFIFLGISLGRLIRHLKLSQ